MEQPPKDDNRKGLIMASIYEETIYEWERDYDGGANLHANAYEMDEIRDFLTRNGYREVYDESGRSTFIEGRR